MSLCSSLHQHFVRTANIASILSAEAVWLEQRIRCQRVINEWSYVYQLWVTVRAPLTVLTEAVTLWLQKGKLSRHLSQPIYLAV